MQSLLNLVRSLVVKYAQRWFYQDDTDDVTPAAKLAQIVLEKSFTTQHLLKKANVIVSSNLHEIAARLKWIMTPSDAIGELIKPSTALQRCA